MLKKLCKMFVIGIKFQK